MSIGAVIEIANRHEDVTRAEDSLRVLDRLVALTDLRSALFVEWLAAEIELPERDPGQQLLASSEFGSLLIADPDQPARRTDTALAALESADRPFSQEQLDEARVEPDDRPPTIAGLSQRLGPLYDATVRRQLQLAEPLRVSIVIIADRQLVGAGTTFERAIELPGAAAELMRALAELDSAESERRPTLQSDVAAAAAHYERVNQRFIRSVEDPDFGRPAIDVQPPTLPPDLGELVELAVSGGLTDPERVRSEPSPIDPALVEAIDWVVGVDTIPAIAAAGVVDEARRVVGEERSAEQRVVALVVAVIVASLAVIMALARSITVPVDRLTNQARQIGAGNLDVAPLPTRGPPDVAAASAAMNDVVDNLQLIRHKTTALQEARLSDPVLATPLPGPLGKELDRAHRRFVDTLIERESIQAKLDHAATHDALTGLVNRAGLAAELQTAAALAPDRPHALLFIDLNDFKRINEIHGHAGGDQLLRTTAERIVDATRSTDVVCRWAGDEFVVLLPDRNADEALELAGAVVNTVSRPLRIGGSVARVAACVGVAASRATTLAETGGDLVRHADLAAYHAKLSGPGSVVLFDDELSGKLLHQKQIETALATALEDPDDRLFLNFQPILDTYSGELRSIETLVRWHHPDLGLVPPDQFIRAAERSGLIAELDRWILRTALRQLVAWSTAIAEVVSISVNISARTLRQPEFVDSVVDALEQTSVPPRRLMLEITETALIADIDTAAIQLERLRGLGVGISIDDFGTGFTSIAQLRSLPVDELKIDMSFVRALDDADNVVLVRMINDLAHHLRVPTVAEGVETSDQHAALRQIGCDAVQGFLFSPPLDAAEFERRAPAWSTARG